MLRSTLSAAARAAFFLACVPAATAPVAFAEEDAAAAPASVPAQPVPAAVPAEKLSGDDIVRLAWTDPLALRAALQSGADPNARTRSGDYPIIRLAYGGNVDAVEILLDFNARTTVVNRHEYSTPAEALKSLAAVLTDSANQNLKNFNVATAVVAAAPQVTLAEKIRMLQLLLDYGHPADFRDGMGKTPLMLCVQRGNAELARLLVAYGADGEAHDFFDGKTPRDYAVSEEMFRILRGRKMFVPAKRPSYGKIPPPPARPREYPLVRRETSPQRIREATKESALHLAVKDLDAELAASLLAAGTPPISYDNDRKTPLHLLCEQREIPESAFRKIYSAMELRTESSRLLSRTDKRGRIPFHALCETGRVDLAEFLAQKAPRQIFAADSDQNTPLHIVARRGDDGYAFAQFLLERGADVTKKNAADDTPLTIAVHAADSKMFYLLAQALKIDPVTGINPLIGEPLFMTAVTSMSPSAGRARNEKLFEILRALIDYGIDANTSDPVTRENALHRAVAANCESAVKYLLTTDIEINKKNANGETPLDVAIKNNLGAMQSLLKSRGANAPKTEAEQKQQARSQREQMTPEARRAARREKRLSEREQKKD